MSRPPASGMDPDTPPTRDAPRRGRSLGRDLPVAIASGVALAAVFLASLFVSPWVFLTFILVLATIGLLELASAFRAAGLRPSTPVAVAAAPLLVLGTYAWGPVAQSAAIVLLVVGSSAWVLLRRSGTQRAATHVAVTCLMALWVPGLGSFLGLLLRLPSGEWYVMATIALSVTNDIGAYAFGNRFGRHLLLPAVSPGKTWEGFVGGLATVLLLAVLVTAQVPGFTLSSALLFAVGIVLAATVGDLTESLVKRDLGVKDLGRILPGHGGIMDRVDAIIFAIPVAYFLLLALT